MATISALPKTNTEIQYSVGEEGGLDTLVLKSVLPKQLQTDSMFAIIIAIVISVEFGLAGLFYTRT